MVLYACIYMWLHIAIHTHIYNMYALKRCVKYIPSTFTTRKLVYTIPN